MQNCQIKPDSQTLLNSLITQAVKLPNLTAKLPGQMPTVIISVQSYLLQQYFNSPSYYLPTKNPSF